MYYLSSIDMCSDYELENELKQFFVRLHHIKQRLSQERATLTLNRTQRKRCRQNILDLEKLERDFYALSYKEDIKHLYRKIHRYVKLDHERLMETFGRETMGRCSLFIAL
ncbi:hypothetical protein ACM66Z_03735 [Sulfurovum sp. ST-21]|uniref:Uncharacterized protein n=1 Tax=Sulfurovum indicum TaxID=2779528 RepID=A0A7M1S7A0_9BACT|nr:hypothetical protein [Sulfurovum indicum]QOR62589.1 hypothetical protein IMZ28_03715 [Sulfurovum indicum]